MRFTSSRFSRSFQCNWKDKRAKFVVTSLGETARYDNYEQDFLWLVRAGVGLKVNKVTEPKPPLRRTQRAASFKLYQSDTGMLGRPLSAEPGACGLHR